MVGIVVVLVLSVVRLVFVGGFGLRLVVLIRIVLVGGLVVAVTRESA
jgi:hypothetical protein